MTHLQLYCFGWSSKKQTHQLLIAHPISVSAASSPFYHGTSSQPATHKLLTELLLMWGLKTPLSHDKSLCLPWPSLIFLNHLFFFFAPLHSFSFALDINEVSVLPSEFLFCFCSSIFVCNKGDCIICYWQRRMTFKVTYKARPTPIRGQVTCS